MKKYPLIMMISLIAFAACKKDKDNEDGEPAKTGFVDKKWVLESMTINPAIDLNGDGTAETDMMDFSDPCVLDDITTFRKDGKTVLNDGKLRCNEENPQERVTGTWSYDEATKQLTTQETGESPSTVQVVKIDDQHLVLKQEMTTDDGTVYTITVTLKKAT
ncbi:DUF5004 domain-containing protein [Olivibacter ginsenosidimutans]